MQKEYKFAYIAGLVDGEGTITLTYNNKVDLFRAPILSMSSTSKELLVFLQKEFGGSIVRHKTYKEHHKESWSWRVQRQKALRAIESIFPYLQEKEKRRRAQILLKDYKNLTPRNGKYSQQQHQAKLDFEQRFFAS